jgi:hypothetical protein
VASFGGGVSFPEATGGAVDTLLAVSAHAGVNDPKINVVPSSSRAFDTLPPFIQPSKLSALFFGISRAQLNKSKALVEGLTSKIFSDPDHS